MKGSIRFNDAVNAEVTTDGTDITKVVNVATGEEYGGGGSGDLSYVTVTLDVTDYVQNVPVAVKLIQNFESAMLPDPESEDGTYIYVNTEAPESKIQIPYDKSQTNVINMNNLVVVDVNLAAYVFDFDNSPFSVEGNAEALENNGSATFTGDFTIHIGVHVD